MLGCENMLSYFPEIRDEESSYSIFSRLQFALQPPNLEIMGNMLFGKKFEVGRLNFQGSFDFLCKQLPTGYTSEKFLYNNTIFPVYIPFTNKEKQNNAIHYFKGDYADKTQKCLHLSEITKNRTYLRFCKECITEDLENYGEPFYRRQHEIEINRMCSKHKTPLYEYTIFPYKIPSRYNDIYTILNCAKEIEIPEAFRTKFIDIANDIAFIFAADLTGWNIEITKEKIHNKIIDKGYVSIKGQTNQKNFSKDFIDYYTEEFLQYIGFNFDIDDNDSWLRHTTTRKKPICDPVKYILVINYLFGSFKNFYSYKDKHNFFNTAPYPCLNKVCPNYNKLVINECSISNSHNHPLAVFKCEYCGYTYSRRGPDKTINDIYKKTYVKDYGYLWLDDLKRFNEQGFSLRKMSKLLGCPNLDTIKRYIEKITSGNLINDEKKEFSEENDLLLVDKYKSMFLKMLNENPKMNALSAYKENPTAYNLISKSDKNWIENNFLIKKNHICSNENRLKKYWEDKDIFLSDKINKSIAKIKTQQDLYERITIALLQKHIGYYNLHQNKSNLPKCFRIINLECETIQDYQKRRIDYVMKQMADESKRFTFAKVFRYAGLRDGAMPEVLNYVQQKIDEHNQCEVMRENMQDC